MENILEEIENLPQRLCKKCGKCCKALNCEKLSDSNFCLIYEKRPENCQKFPSSIWEELPEGCGFEGWVFQQRERIKQQIRKQKEILLLLEITKKNAPKNQIARMNENISKIKELIELYAKYGSNDW